MVKELKDLEDQDEETMMGFEGLHLLAKGFGTGSGMIMEPEEFGILWNSREKHESRKKHIASKG